MMELILRSSFVLLCYRSLMCITLSCAGTIDPRKDVDMLDSFKLPSRHQCHNLCWYWKRCARYSYYSKNDHSGDNCVLHLRAETDGDLDEGWIKGKPSNNHLNSEHGCAPRPCTEHEVCIPTLTNVKFICAEMPSDAWLGQSCQTTCASPPSAEHTECVYGQCLCAAGYFYSQSQRTCLSACGELGNSYLRYKFHDLSGHDTLTMWIQSDVGECKLACNEDPTCLMIVHNLNSNVCFLKNATPLNDPDKWIPISNGDAYQRTCA